MTDITQQVLAESGTEQTPAPDNKAFYIDSIAVVDLEEGADGSLAMPIKVTWDNVVLQDLLSNQDTSDITLKQAIIGQFNGSGVVREFDKGFLTNQSIVQFLQETKANYDKEFWGIYNDEGEYIGSFLKNDDIEKYYPKSEQDRIKDLISGSLFQILVDRADYWSALPDDVYTGNSSEAIAVQSDIKSLFQDSKDNWVTGIDASTIENKLYTSTEATE